MSVKKQVDIYYWDYESEAGGAIPSEHELQVRLVERDMLHDPQWSNLNAMSVDWRDKGKVFWEPEMSSIDLLIQFKLLKGENYVGSVSFPLRDIFRPGKDFKQWLTVFDTIEDDIFDGVIGTDDEETPRIRVGFGIKSIDPAKELQESHESEEPKRRSVKDTNKQHEDHKAVRSSHAAKSGFKDEGTLAGKRSPSQGENHRGPSMGTSTQNGQNVRQSATVGAGQTVLPTKSSGSKRIQERSHHDHVEHHVENDTKRIPTGKKDIEHDRSGHKHEEIDTKSHSNTNTTAAKTPERSVKVSDSGMKKSSAASSGRRKEEDHHEDEKLNESHKATSQYSAGRQGSSSKATSGHKTNLVPTKDIRQSQEITSAKKSGQKTDNQLDVRKSQQGAINSMHQSNFADSLQSRDSIALRAFQSERSTEDLEMRVSELTIEQEKLKLSLDNCNLVIQDLQKQQASLQEENSSLSGTLSSMRQTHRRALLAAEERVRESEEKAHLAEIRERKYREEAGQEDSEVE